MPGDPHPAPSSAPDLEKTPGAGSRGWTPPPPEDIARLLPGYDVLSLLGRGGMGAVYLAVQRALDRAVAIKLLPLEVSADAAFADRFVREARAMAKLSHPHIIAVHDFGKTSEGHLYIVMEYVDGANLHEMIHGPGLSPAQSLSIAAQVCEALAYAHARGVVHRDIKPANVMVDQSGQAKVADFGLARLIDPTAEHLGTTGTGTIMGTPDYMAPEQRSGMQIDHRADIYSLGVMIYEMLCGEVPRGVFEPPSCRVECDTRVDQVVTRAMQQEPRLRYQSTQEMKTDVDAARTPLEKAESKASRTRVAAIVAASLVLASAAGFFLWEKVNPSRAAHAAESSPALQRVEPSAAAGRPDGLKPATTLATATKDAPFVNTLGMKFVPVPILGGPTGGQRVLFSVWDTRVQDYEVFVQETKREWPKADFPQEPTHPAVYVTWDDAQLFCQWLTAREHAAGRLGANERYRLPSDHEWSCAVGIGAREDAAILPSEKDGKITDAFPWGTQWPPPKGTGNYAVEELQPDRDAGKSESAKALGTDSASPGELVAAGYNDGFVNTSPVGSFAANRFGLYDLGGNVRQWCEDWFDREQNRHVLRGASWNDKRRSSLLSSSRRHNSPTRPGNSDGFRCVVAGSAPPAAVAPSSITTAPTDAPFVNTLGMKFVPVPILGGPTGGQRVLFSVWDTRVQDYATFATETQRSWAKAEFEQGLTHPAVMVSWDDATAFCAWLTERERKAGHLGANERYRLPSDHEWSCGVGIGGREDAGMLPVQNDKKLGAVFPWDSTWPPPDHTGNYQSEELQPARDAGKYPWTNSRDLPGYHDGFAETSPVDSFAANRFGLHDMGGNVWQWCEDWFDSEHKERVLRGASWVNGTPGSLRSSYRNHYPTNYPAHHCGFRCVLAGPAAPRSAAPPR